MAIACLAASAVSAVDSLAQRGYALLDGSGIEPPEHAPRRAMREKMGRRFFTCGQW